ERENETDVVLRGRTVRVRGLTVRDRDLLRVLFLRPTPPVGKNPDKGDLAPEEPLVNDPGYRAKVEARTAQVLAAEFAIATRWQTEDGGEWDPTKPEAECRAWAKRAAAEVAGSGLSDAEVETVFRAVALLERGGDPRGNSSSGSTPVSE
ncbi:MAG: hypothetical protein KC933_41255, partial [Myxococcales bacterium]|nr:hypothetical protein [Myxococcales bacterium]